MDSQRLADATVRECFEISKKYRENFAAKHGTMHNLDSQQNSWDATAEREAAREAERLRLEYQRGMSEQPPSQVAPPPTPIAPETGAVRPAPARDWQRWVLPIAFAGLTGAGGWIAHDALTSEAPPPAGQEARNESPGGGADSGSLLQWLEDEGLHLAPNGNGRQ